MHTVMHVGTSGPVALISALALFLVSCARPAENSATRVPVASLGSAGVEPGVPSIPWSRKTRDQRLEFMGLYVYPKMRAVFEEHDAKAYAQFRCQTCHGDDMEAKDFKMPNGLYALPADDPLKAAREYDAKTAEFMEQKIVPAMRELLGSGDPSTAQAFGCLSCHRTE